MRVGIQVTLPMSVSFFVAWKVLWHVLATLQVQIGHQQAEHDGHFLLSYRIAARLCWPTPCALSN